MNRIKVILVTILVNCLPFLLKAQSAYPINYDVFARFPKYSGAYEAYIAVYVDKPKHINHDQRSPLDITVAISKTGRASVIHIAHKISPEVDSAFIKAILTAPNWKPAILNKRHVNASFDLHYDIEFNKAQGTFTIEVDREISPLGNVRPKYRAYANIYNAVEIQPQFAGGKTAFNNFLKKNIRYPAIAKRNNIQGRAFIQFIVEKNGRLTNYKILRDPGYGLGAEALRLLKKSPRWIPGIQNGKAVRVEYTVPVSFNIDQ